MVWEWIVYRSWRKYLLVVRNQCNVFFGGNIYYSFHNVVQSMILDLFSHYIAYLNTNHQLHIRQAREQNRIGKKKRIIEKNTKRTEHIIGITTWSHKKCAHAFHSKVQAMHVSPFHPFSPFRLFHSLSLPLLPIWLYRFVCILLWIIYPFYK